MIRLEMAEAEETIERASEELKILLLPKDPYENVFNVCRVKELENRYSKL